MYKFSFEKLEIWNLSISFCKEIYLVSSKFPANEKFGITSQIRRSASSISANIAEGSSRLTEKDKARFIQIAYSSLMETLSFLMLAKELDFIKNDELDQLRSQISELSNKINAYHKKLR